MCMVLSKPADPAGVAQARAWLGMEPLLSSVQGAIYVFGRSGGKPTPLGAAMLSQALRAGEARMVVIPQTPSATSLLIYATPRPAV